jgi:UDP-3-O-[3-hydroxymyristoyl] glucosamine N-acyltransferase
MRLQVRLGRVPLGEQLFVMISRQFVATSSVDHNVVLMNCRIGNHVVIKPGTCIGQARFRRAKLRLQLLLDRPAI